MTDSAWNPALPEVEFSEEDFAPTAPAYTIFDLPEGEFKGVPEIRQVNFYPTAEARRRDRRTRHVAILLAVNPDSGLVPVVQPEKANLGEWSLIQGGIKPNETAVEAAHREAWEEAGMELLGATYVGSYRALVHPTSHKKKKYDAQVFHAFVAKTNAVQVTPRCEGVAYATCFHKNEVLPLLLQSASPVKQHLLPVLFQAAVEKELLTPAACHTKTSAT